MRASIASLLMLVLLCACTTIDPAERRRTDEAQCRGYGFRRGSDAFAECLQRTDLDRRADRRARLYGPGGVYRPYGPYGGIGVYGGY